MIKNEVQVLNNKDPQLVHSLLSGSFVSYQNPLFEVTSGDHQVLMKLRQTQAGAFLLYSHIPSSYPLPDDVKSQLIADLKKANPSIGVITFVNASAELRKKELPFKLGLPNEYNNVSRERGLQILETVDNDFTAVNQKSSGLLDKIGFFKRQSQQIKREPEVTIDNKPRK